MLQNLTNFAHFGGTTLQFAFFLLRSALRGLHHTRSCCYTLSRSYIQHNVTHVANGTCVPPASQLPHRTCSSRARVGSASERALEIVRIRYYIRADFDHLPHLKNFAASTQFRTVAPKSTKLCLRMGLLLVLHHTRRITIHIQLYTTALRSM